MFRIVPLILIFAFSCACNKNYVFINNVKIKDLPSLDLEGLNLINSDLEKMKNFTKAHTIYLANNPKLNNLDKIIEFDLISLDISNTGVRDISVITKLVNLKFLKLSGTKVNNLKGLNRLSQICSIELSNTRINDLKPLRNHTEIGLFNGHNTDIEDISSLNNNLFMQELDVSFTKVNNLNQINKLLKIELLNLEKTKITSIAVLSSFENLRELNISDNNISNLSPISELIKLVKLNFYKTPNTSLKVLEKLENLKELTIPSHITDLTPLLKLTKLSLLKLSVDYQKNKVLNMLQEKSPKCKIQWLTEAKE